MAKGFKKFRDEYEDEWGSYEERNNRKESRMKNRRDNRKNKLSEKWYDVEREDFNRPNKRRKK